MSFAKSKIRGNIPKKYIPNMAAEYAWCLDHSNTAFTPHPKCYNLLSVA
jgi:hypothetical protein